MKGVTMLKKMLGVMVCGALSLSLLGGCAANDSESTDNGNGGAESTTSAIGAFDSEEEQNQARELVKQAMADKVDWELPNNNENYHLAKVVGTDGKVFYDCLMFSDDSESNAYVAVDADGNVHAMDVDREVVVDYSPEFLEALSAASANAEDLTYQAEEESMAESDGEVEVAEEVTE